MIQNWPNNKYTHINSSYYKINTNIQCVHHVYTKLHTCKCIYTTRLTMYNHTLHIQLKSNFIIQIHSCVNKLTQELNTCHHAHLKVYRSREHPICHTKCWILQLLVMSYQQLEMHNANYAVVMWMWWEKFRQGFEPRTINRSSDHQETLVDIRSNKYHSPNHRYLMFDDVNWIRNSEDVPKGTS